MTAIHLFTTLHKAGLLDRVQRKTVCKTEFSLALVKSKYLETWQNIPNTGSHDQDAYIYGKVKDRDIGYVYLNGIEADDRDFMDYVLRQIGNIKP